MGRWAEGKTQGLYHLTPKLNWKRARTLLFKLTNKWGRSMASVSRCWGTISTTRGPVTKITLLWAKCQRDLWAPKNQEAGWQSNQGSTLMGSRSIRNKTLPLCWMKITNNSLYKLILEGTQETFLATLRQFKTFLPRIETTFLPSPILFWLRQSISWKITT